MFYFLNAFFDNLIIEMGGFKCQMSLLKTLKDTSSKEK